MPKPSPELMPNPAAGKSLFKKHCADASFQLAAKNGVRAHLWQFGDMAPVPQATPDDVAHITAYVCAEQRKVGIR